MTGCETCEGSGYVWELTPLMTRVKDPCPDCNYAPKVACPRCGREQADYDGFAVQFCSSCGYCTHPSRAEIGGGAWKCDLCGRVS